MLRSSRGYRGWLALSLAVHAGVLAVFVLANGWRGAAAPQGQVGARAAGGPWIRVSLLRESPSASGEVAAPPPRAERAPAPAPAAARRPARLAKAAALDASGAATARSARARTTPAPGAPPEPVRAAVSPGASHRASGRSPSAHASAWGGHPHGWNGPWDWPGPGEVDRAARPRWPIRPDYPPRARREGREATVVVAAWVDEAGRVAFSSVLESGGDDFDASAQRAVDRSRFRPARREGRDVASRVALRVHFQLYD